jgi:ligand-binding sensor domain-containing protein/signal transduction histidine kinase
LAQQPSYIKITTEEGLPSNEVYSIIQDQKGFIWVGCDAGLFKYDGIRFIHYKNSNQKSNSLSGLTLAPSGRIYTYSFKGQMFYIENDSLHELAHDFGRIQGITFDKNSNIWINHSLGVASYSEVLKLWTDYKDVLGGDVYTNSLKSDINGCVWFIYDDYVGSIKDGVFTSFSFSKINKLEDQITGNFFIEKRDESFWGISRSKGNVYHLLKDSIYPYPSNTLTKELKGRKVTSLSDLEDGSLWVSTYSGMVVYYPEQDSVRVISPELAFSCMLKDREGSFWFGTIHNGIIKVPNMDYVVWNAENFSLFNDVLVKVIKTDSKVFFATVDGSVGELDDQSQIKLYQAEINADVQQIYFDPSQDKLYFNINQKLYSVYKNKLSTINNSFAPIKSMIKLNHQYFIATSKGLYIYNNLEDENASDTLIVDWCRQLKHHDNTLWVAGNNGLYQIEKKDKWIVSNTFFKGILTVDLAIETLTNTIYTVTFDGKINRVKSNSEETTIASLPSLTQPFQIKFYKNLLYIATNRGLWIYSIKDNSFKVLNKQMGLASDNVQNIAIDDDFIWLATGNGLQKIPLNFSTTYTKGIVYLKKLLVNGNPIAIEENVKLNYNQSLSFQLEASNYISNGKFKYAYRLKKDDDWLVFPGNIEQIDIPNLPTGKFQLEIKLIDYLGEDSENSIIIKGIVQTPYWQQWWFYLVSILFVSLTIYYFFKKRISYIEKRQAKEIDRLKLENDLRLTQQAALKAQMNPHFLFNVLNSIKGYIYENDKKNAALYLNDFSDLVRKVLELSALPKVKLEEEINVVELYIKLEAMLLQQSFSYTIEVDKSLDSSAIYIPALIIQPFIENSFKHGLRHKQGDKHLDLHISLEGLSTLIVEIIDNGIGRKASAEINSKQDKNHTSFATSAIENRIALLNHEKSGIIGIEIIDLLDGVKPLGTKVILRINIDEQGR